MRIYQILAVATAVALLGTACTTSETELEPEATEVTVTTVPLLTVPSDYVGFLHQPTACGAERPEPAVHMTFDAPNDVSVTGPTRITLNTSCGPIEIELDPAIAPETVNSFVFLAEEGFFDGTVSHRVLPDFMMQAGDPTATGLGGPGYTLPDEFPEEGTVFVRGTVAMANAGPGTTGSQFFIMFADSDWLPAVFTIIGHVTSGFDTLDLIADLPLGRSANSADPNPSTPLESLYIESVSIDR